MDVKKHELILIKWQKHYAGNIFFSLAKKVLYI